MSALVHLATRSMTCFERKNSTHTNYFEIKAVCRLFFYTKHITLVSIFFLAKTFESVTLIDCITLIRRSWIKGSIPVSDSETFSKIAAILLYMYA